MTGTRMLLGIVSVAVLATQVLAAQATPNCEAWNTDAFFETATPEEVTACLDAGADPRAPDERGRTPLHRAAGSNENPAVLETLLVAGADVAAQYARGYTPLHYAAALTENPAIIETLLAAGADPMARAEYFGVTPLHEAAS